MPRIVVDGNEAAARIAYALSEVVAIYPITPPRRWASTPTPGPRPAGRTCGARCPRVVEMQSEAGAAGALHGALLQGRWRRRSPRRRACC